MNLQVRFILILGISFFLLSLTIVLILFYDFRSQEIQNAEERAEIILNRNLATHQYFTEQLKPSVFSIVDKNKSEEYFDPSWMSSTYAVREIDKIYRDISDKNYYYKEAAIDARSPENEADPVEREFIQTLNKNPEVEKRTLVRTIEGEKYFQLLRKGETMGESCLRCHSTPDKAPKEMVEIYGPERSYNREVGEVVS
ncbi:MAG: DUF3365 domain-containing protein, partial [Spirochaetales bacterium]|nr:DUF3365 domain-containing protein [Spirochaetales bacterium]